MQAGGELLQHRLEVQPVEAQRGGRHAIGEQALDEAEGRRRPTIEVHRTQHRLEGIAEDRRLGSTTGGVFAFAQQDAVAQPDLERDLGQRRCVDHALAQVGELAFGEIAVHSVGQVGHHPAEHGVAQELEPLVAGRATHFGAPAAMSQRTAQQARIPELVAEVPTELGEIWVWPHRTVSCP